MEKVKVTQDQADMLEGIDDKGAVLSSHIKYGWAHHDTKCLNKLSIDEMARALYVGYEVEPEFEKGDYVVWCGSVVIIDHPQTHDRKDDGACYFTIKRSDGSTYGNIARDQIRHATESEVAEEKQRRWWKNHDRDVWELKPKDVLVAEDGGYLVEVKRVLSCGSPLFYGGVKSIPLDEVEEMFKVVCFAKDRKDV